MPRAAAPEPSATRSRSRAPELRHEISIVERRRRLDQRPIGLQSEIKSSPECGRQHDQLSQSVADGPATWRSHDLTQITSPGSYDDDYVQGLEKLGIVNLPAHLRRALSSESSTESPSGVDQKVRETSLTDRRMLPPRSAEARWHVDDDLI